MKALTIYQPWATLIAIGAKHIETRSWSTKYRGPLAVHAGKVLDHEVYGFRFVKTALEDAGYANHLHLPKGSFVAVCDLADVRKIESDSDWRRCVLEIHGDYSKALKEAGLGDYRDGRYMWLLDNVRPLPAPVPAKGKQRLWNTDMFVAFKDVDIRGMGYEAER